MRCFLVNWTRIILVVILVGMFGAVYAQVSVANVLQLWNVRNHLDWSYTQSGNINLNVTHPDSIISWATSTSYEEGNIRKYGDYAYWCSTSHTSGSSFEAGNWTQMWEAAKGWDPIGTEGSPFKGVYDGNGKDIYNLYINRGADAANDDALPQNGTDNVGLFGYVTSGTDANTEIKDLGIINPNVTGKRGTGALVGKVLIGSSATKKVYITRCYATVYNQGDAIVVVRGFGATGGLVGANNSDRKQQIPVIRYCWANVKVESTHPGNYKINPNDPVTGAGTNPYNIKYGGLVGCNETGISYDSFAFGEVTGGDRVGGLAGCTIDGAILRCYATGNVQQGIASGSGHGTWDGGIGGLTGRVDGKLPPGLGGYSGSASVQNSYYLSSATITDLLDNPVSGILTEMARTDTLLRTQTTFVNWDFVNVWSFTAGYYPNVSGVGISFVPAETIPQYYYKSVQTPSPGTIDYNWSDYGNWLKSLTGAAGPYDTQNTPGSQLYPGLSNSFGIIVATGSTITLDHVSRDVDQMSIESGGTLIIGGGNRLSVENGINPDIDLINNGNIIVNAKNPANLTNPNDKALFEIGYSATFENNGSVTIYGNLYNNGTITSGAGSSITFAGDAKQYFKNDGGNLNNLIVDNPVGVEFLTPIIIDGTLTVTRGQVTGASNTDGMYSPDSQRLEIAESGNLISGFSAATDLGGNYPELIKRQWTINGFVDDSTEENRVKSMTFYWTADDDNSFDWSGITPALYVGSSTTGITGTFTNSDGIRKLVVSYTFPQTAGKNGAKASFTIGREDNQTLPVELSFFNAQMYQGNSIRLQWQTQSETNVSGFQIYRGTSDLFAEALLLDVFINATNTSQAQYYVFYDRELYAPGTYYYWLESVDFDGSSQLYGSIPVYFEGIEPGLPSIPAITGIVKNYPNPFNP
ncbi:MAG: hypothetical protein PHR59_08730, partial [Candidatus Cloacimonetes bacterium]|nr:hypothetical protein [Candidatus Cloacimonadota bacterium]